MKTIQATILVFDSQSSIEEVKKYIGENVYLYSGEVPELSDLKYFDAAFVRKNSITFTDDAGDEYENFAVIEFDN